MQTMTPEFLRVLSLRSDFPNTAGILVRTLGIETSARLIAAWGGQEWPVPARKGGGTAAGARRYERMVELVGEAAACLMVNEFGSEILKVPNLKNTIWKYHREQIREEFDALTMKGGMSSPAAVFELGVKYGVAGRTVEKILKTL